MSAGIVAILQDRLSTWAVAQPIDVAWAGVPYEPVMGTPHIAAQTVAYTRAPTGPGENAPIKHSGIFQMTLRFPPSEGEQPVRTLASTLANLFRRGTSLTTTDGLLVRCEVPDTPASIFESEWISVPIRVPFFAYEFPT